MKQFQGGNQGSVTTRTVVGSLYVGSSYTSRRFAPDIVSQALALSL